MARRHREGESPLVNPETDDEGILGLLSRRRREETVPKICVDDAGSQTEGSFGRQTYFEGDIIMVPEEEPKVSTRTRQFAGSF